MGLSNGLFLETLMVFHSRKNKNYLIDKTVRESIYRYSTNEFIYIPNYFRFLYLGKHFHGGYETEWF